MTLSLTRRFALAACGAGAALALAACSPVVSNQPYSASDGLRVVWEEGAPIRGENILVLTEAQGADARVVGGITNGSDADAEVAIGFVGGASEVILVPAGSTVLLDGSAQRDLILPDAPVPPGAVAEMSFETPTQGVVQMAIPVLDGTLAEYEDLVP